MVARSAPEAASPWTRVGLWAARVRLSRILAVTLTIAALVAGVLTYVALSGSGTVGHGPQNILVILIVDLVLVLLLSAVLLRRVVSLWIERRRGSAGSRLHVRFAALFSVVAVAPAIVVAVFSVLFLSLGVEAWFSERVRTALNESLAVAEAYLNEHRQMIRADALAMANDVNRAAPTLANDPKRFNRFLETQAAIRALTEVMVFRPDGRVIGRTGLTFSLIFEPVPLKAIEKARDGEVVVLTSKYDDRVRALVRLAGLVDAYLYVGRFVDSRVIAHMERTQRAVSEYKRTEVARSSIQITFALIFGIAALLLLLASVWLGLSFATHLARPISQLVGAAERVRAGDLSARVAEGPADDEIGGLSRAFNRMTDQLESQRAELVEANLQLDTRRRFTESVLSGVSAGVIGLDSEGRIELPNRSALVFLSARPDALIGSKLSAAAPEMGALMEQAMRHPDRRAEDQITIVRDGRTRNLLVRISAERLGDELEGFVVTFDDITALVTAQRTAAWADVARRIAHEIKNPLTPIQLSAERLKRKYQNEIKSDPEVFANCTDTIVRHVGDIGRMIDEFSSFARMPAPVFRIEDVLELARQAVGLQKVAHPDIAFVEAFPDGPMAMRCDGRQVVQVLTNLLQNAVESIESRDRDHALEPGEVRVGVEATSERVVIEVRDNGRGLPADLRDRLVEPYVTTHSKGTGLGLAIVKKIMEDHGGELVLEDGERGGACVRLIFPMSQPEQAEESSKSRKVASHGA